MKITCIDFETTGAVPGYPNEPWQLGMVDVVDGRVDASTKWDSLFKVGDRPFSPRAVGRYAEMREELAAASAPFELWPSLARRLVGVPLAAHNAGTERTVLTKLAPLTRFGPWVDTLKLGRKLYPGIPSHKLGDFIAYLQLQPRVDELCPGRTWHDALYDACAGAVLLEHFLSLPCLRGLASGIFDIA